MRNLLIITLASLIVLGVSLVVLGYSTRKKAKLMVNSDKVVNVYVNGAMVGKTPYEGIYEPNEYLVKLETEDLMLSYETRINLVSGVSTIVNRNLNDNYESQSGDLISFEKTSEKNSSIAVVTEPDAVKIILSGEDKGFSPIKISEMIPSQYNLVLSAPGYINREINLQTVAGYKITLISKLSKDVGYVNKDYATVLAANKEQQVLEIEKIKVDDTPTGFLRVREEPVVSSKEVFQVSPGEEFELIEEKDGWFKIKLDELKEGWISGEFASKTIENTNDQEDPKEN